jgi:hypothetical protein
MVDQCSFQYVDLSMWFGSAVSIRPLLTQKQVPREGDVGRLLPERDMI